MRTELSAVLLVGLLAACASPHVTADPETPVERNALVDGRRVHYLDAGVGTEALVLVHGWASSVVTWRHQFPELATRARVLAVDLPGHGESEPPADDYSMMLFADAVVAVMDDAGVERGVIVGHSNGAPVALNVYRRHPDRTLAFMVIDGTLRSTMTPDAAEAMFAPFREEGWQDVLAGMIAGMSGPNLSEQDRIAVREMALATSHDAVIGGFEAAIDPQAWSDEGIDVPLLLVLAQQPTWDEAYERWVRERAPRVDYRVWTGVGHYLHMERPDELRAVLDEFLAQYDLLEGPAVVGR